MGNKKITQRIKRCANFTRHEKELLIDIVINYIDIIENKKTNANVWQLKKDAWERIRNDFNAGTKEPRTAKTLRLKYEGIKKEIRKKNASKIKGSTSNSTVFSSYEEKTILALQRSSDSPSMFDEDECKDILQKQLSNCEIEIERTGDEDMDNHAPALSQTQTERETSPTRTRVETEEVEVQTERAGPSRTHEKEDELDTTEEEEIKIPKGEIVKNYIRILEVKEDCLKLQKQLLNEEMEAKKIILDLTIQNLKADLELKKCKIDQLKKNIVSLD